MNELKELFKKQQLLQKTLGTFPLTNDNKQDFITVQSLALIDEVMEALHETPWKPWKKCQTLNTNNFKNELVDAWHFLINLSLASGMDYKELYDRFIQKNKENHNRQKEGY